MKPSGNLKQRENNMAEVFVKPTTIEKPASTEGTEPKPADQAVPDDLKQFVGEDGKLDTSKIAQSYRELNKKFTSVSQEKSTLERAYQVVIGGKPVEPDRRSTEGTGRISLEEVVADPTAAIEAGVKRTLKTEAAPIVQAVLEIAHPEVGIDPETGGWKDPEFVEGLQKYSASLPASLRTTLNEDFTTADWVIRNYKRLREGTKGKAGESVLQKKPAQELESAAQARVKTGDKRFTKQEIEALMRKPKEYEKVADEIGKAYEEGRVD